MPKSGRKLSHRKRKARGETSDEESSPNAHHRKNTGAVNDTEAAVQRETPSRGESHGVVTRSISVRHDTRTVHYVCGGKLEQVELKIPVIELEDILAAES
ncbi:hypothetical protein HPB50_002238 [Hyalomma asiaticum]|uniref:Uncharacterized protein n=1 Tax=Hyalomma asiaticum TaxID=266040 RepID=A0ACB7TD42_HYAAI|nr:hypothetical protein HPB50_002238 [Hyalomma asiaticum]